MTKMNQHIKSLYKKFLYDNITSDEHREMQHSLNSVNDDELSEMMYYEWNENILSGRMNREVKDDIHNKLNFYIEFDKKKIRRSRMLKIAAVLLPLIIVGSVLLYSLFQQNNDTGNMIVSVERGNKALITLPDQSKVWINANSTIEYSQAQTKTRYVTLTGEAFFKVTEDKTRPFIVSMKDLEIEVLGTSFNAKARENSDIIETSLVEGSIKLKSNSFAQNYYLKPNEKAIFNKTTRLVEIAQTDNDLETAWVYNRLKFSSERFEDVLNLIEEWYGVEIINECPDISNDLISGTFKEENIENALQSLIIQYPNIKFKRQKNSIIIYNKLNLDK